MDTNHNQQHPLVCFKCGQCRHMARNCPNQQAKFLTREVMLKYGEEIRAFMNNQFEMHVKDIMGSFQDESSVPSNNDSLEEQDF